jgi:subtilisin family serine protease
MVTSASPPVARTLMISAFFNCRSLRARFRHDGSLVAICLLATVALVATVSQVRAVGDESVPIRDAQPAVLREDLLEKLGVTRWHGAGIRGAGVKVAILDSGFRGYRDFLGTSLPAEVTVHSFRVDGNLEAKDSQHGILCGEVIHTIAPAAEILLANWEPDCPEAFLEAVRWAKKEGARVINCSVIMPSWSDGEGHGSIHRALTQILGNDVLFCASAGNTAKRHWTGTFHDRGDGYHEWEIGQIDNALTRLGSERVSIELCWKPGPDYDLNVVDRDTGEVVSSSPAGGNVQRGAAVARFVPAESHRYAVEIRRVKGAAPSTFHLVALSTGSELEFSDRRGSVCFPADGPEVVAVGAVDGLGQRMPYSSCGRDSGELKPDLVARVPFPSQWREMPFSGTSAAAPQVSALAALLLSRDPSSSPPQVRQQLRLTAIRGTRGTASCETGFGLIHLPANGPYDPQSRR